MMLNLNKVVMDTQNMDRNQMIGYLKRYKGRELIALANELGFRYSVNTPKTVALEKVLRYLIENNKKVGMF